MIPGSQKEWQADMQERQANFLCYGVDVTKNYLCKYMIKQHYDDRFFAKHQYHQLKCRKVDGKARIMLAPHRYEKYSVLTHDGIVLVHGIKNIWHLRIHKKGR